MLARRTASSSPIRRQHPEPVKQEFVKAPAKTQPAVAATAQEWRTPPLWGVRDSGPYLHDGGPQRWSKRSPSTEAKRGIDEEVQCSLVVGETEAAGVS